ncbi:MAG: SOS response-associated peptidase [Lachnospiraceae bacterium]|nr:SOS response-associated peptidase [Lachnospiraceae bacterium]
MCGRYYVDDDTAREIERIIRIADEKVRNMTARDIHPTDIAPILVADDRTLCCHMQKWGLPGFDGKQVIFNARSESVLEKLTFREAMDKRRIVVPAAGFYEWNTRKEKSIFYRKDQPVLFMAGLYNPYEEGNRFVILTTAANSSMKPVHDRMPLLLEENEILPWMLNLDAAKEILLKVPYLLERKTEFEQLSLF